MPRPFVVRLLAVPSSALRSLRSWLRDVPIADPVDRRNAPVIQVIALLLAVLPPLMWLLRAMMADVPWRPGEVTSMLVGLSVSALAALSFGLLRRGRFMPAARLLLVGFVASTLLAHAATGFAAQRFEQPVLGVWMAIAALALGRGTLWLMYAGLLVAFGFGIAVDIGANGGMAARLTDLAVSAAIFLMLAIVLDRSSAALRDSLREATAHGRALEAANARLQAEMAERERAQVQLVQAQKTEAMGRLASGVAHDFGNLVGIIRGHAHRGRCTDDAARMQDALAGVESAASRAAVLARRLMAFSRAEEEAREWFDPAAAIGGLEPMLRQLLAPSVRIRLSLAAPLPEIHFDRTRFELMVLNIAANADHAMPGGGAFTISARQDAHGSLLLAFGDDGTGMDAAVLARIFEPFFTTRPRGQGTGLGLSVVKDLVEAGGGSIHAESEPGRGSVFFLRIPGRMPSGRRVVAA
jgi:signal transduction histidine kinase